MELVSDVRQCSLAAGLTTHTNGGVQKHEHLANLKLLLIVVHFKDNSMATIISLKTVSEIRGATLTMDTFVSKKNTLAMENGVNCIFNMHENGLNFFDANNSDLLI